MKKSSKSSLVISSLILFYSALNAGCMPVTNTQPVINNSIKPSSTANPDINNQTVTPTPENPSSATPNLSASPVPASSSLIVSPTATPSTSLIKPVFNMLNVTRASEGQEIEITGSNLNSVSTVIFTNNENLSKVANINNKMNEKISFYVPGNLSEGISNNSTEFTAVIFLTLSDGQKIEAGKLTIFKTSRSSSGSNSGGGSSSGSTTGNVSVDANLEAPTQENP